MKSVKQYIALVVVFLILVSSAKSQSGEECRYLAALTYLRTDSQVNEKIKQFFRDHFNKKEKFFEFNLSAVVRFIDCTNFQDRLKKYATSDSLLNDPKKYYAKYNFVSFRSDFLKNIIKRNTSKIFLTFSKPINDFLMVEFLSHDPELYGGGKFGLGMSIFFKFDAMGLVESVEYGGAIYR